MKKSIIGAMMALFVAPVWADLAENIKNMDHFQAVFHQHVGLPDESPMLYTGELIIARPGLFAWRQVNPDPLLLIADGQTFTTYDPLLSQVILKSQEEALANTPASWLSRDDLSWLDNFKVEDVSELDQCHARECYHLMSMDPELAFSDLIIGFEHGELREMSFEDALGQITTMAFSEVKLNQAIPEHAFDFDLPEDADVIDMR